MSFPTNNRYAECCSNLLEEDVWDVQLWIGQANSNIFLEANIGVIANLRRAEIWPQTSKNDSQRKVRKMRPEPMSCDRRLLPSLSHEWLGGAPFPQFLLLPAAVETQPCCHMFLNSTLLRKNSEKKLEQTLPLNRKPVICPACIDAWNSATKHVWVRTHCSSQNLSFAAPCHGRLGRNH